jgi:exopolysaccharide biosynthesis protein
MQAEKNSYTKIRRKIMKTRIFALALVSGMLFWGINNAAFAQDNTSKKTTKTETKVEHKKGHSSSMTMKSDSTKTKTGKVSHHKKHKASQSKENTNTSTNKSDNTKK